MTADRMHRTGEMQTEDAIEKIARHATQHNGVMLAKSGGWKEQPVHVPAVRHCAACSPGFRRNSGMWGGSERT